MAVKITKRPLLTVTKLSVPVRGSNNRVMTSTWSVPSGLTSTKRNDRATGLEVVWSIGTSKGTPKATLSLGIGSKKSSINLDSMKLGKTKYNRKSFYPFTARKLNSVSISIRAKNGKGKGKILRQTRKFTIPRKPTLTPLSFNTENGVISTTIETNAGADYQERYDTKYAITVTSPFLNGGNPINTSDNASTSTSFSVNYDARDYMRLSYDQFIKVVASAYARGYAGDSAIATRTEYISFPAQASITGIDVSGRDATSKCTIHINTNRTTEHPVDKVKLQYAADVTYNNANDIPASEWTDTEIVDNGNCTALSISTGKLIPSRGNHTYVRVVTYHLNEDVLYRYSEAKLVEELETPSTPAASIDIDILEATAGKDGKTAVVLIGWNKDGRDDFTGTELSWSDNEDTWKSTDEPSHHEFTWSDGPLTYGGVSYHDSAKITIKGLSEGVLYYVRARRYLEAEIEQFSDYTERVPVLTSTMPESIVATAERFIAKGNPLAIRWTLAGNGLQKEWKIARVKNGAQDGTIIAEGDGSAGSTQISAERLSELAVNNSLSFVVEASTGSKPVTSEVHTVTIIEQPTLQITGGSYTHEHEEDENQLHSNNLSLNVASNRLCDLITTIKSQGASGQFPQGVMMQANGDTIHSNVYSPAWRNGTATIAMPTGLDFWDGGRYTVSIVAVDRATGLRSPEATIDFVVSWTNQAVSPVQYSYTLTTDTTVNVDEAYYKKVGNDYVLVIPEGTENPRSEGWYTQNTTSFVTLTVIDERDADGDHTQAVQIALTPPAGSSETDVYDIYRMDIEKPHLIGQGFPLTYTAVDEYAPFGDSDLYYRIAIRTVDGDVEFSDIDYTAECENIRFDWSGGSLELPYGNAIGDSFKKDVDIRHHMNGNTNGYWNQSIERTSSLSSSIIKIVQPRDIEKARLLARYPNAVFVRLPNGSAFTADVQVTDLSVKNKAVTAIAFDATEIELTQEFSLPIPFRLEEE